VPAKLPRLAFAADMLAALLLVVATLTLFVEGPTIWIAGTRVLSLRSPWRIYLWAAAILVVRAWLVPEPRSFDMRRRALRARLQREEPVPVASTTWTELVIVTGAYACWIAALTWPQIIQLRSVPDLGDPLFSLWRMGWIAHQLPRNPMGLFDANIFHSEPLTLTYSDPLLLPSLFGAPFLWLGVDPRLVYNLLLLSAFVFSGVATYVLVRGLTGSREASVVAGATFAAYPYRLEHYPHLELQMTMWMPLVLLGIHRTLASARLRDGLLTGVAYAAQVLSSLYYGVFLAVYLIPFTAILWASRRFPWKPMGQLAAGGVLAASLIAPVAWRFVESRPTVGERHPSAVWEYSATLGDYLKPVRRNLIYAGWAEGGRAERQVFPRFTPVALAVAALAPPWTATQLAYGLGLVVALNGSLGFNGEIYAWLYDYSSVVRGLRVPARFSILVGLTLSVLSGFAVARAIARWPRWRIAITGGILTLLTIEAIPALTLLPLWPEPPPIYHAVTQPDAVLAEFPMGTEEFGAAFDARYLYFSTFHWHKLVNGNSGYFPPSHARLIAIAREFPANSVLHLLRERGVTHITVHGAYFGPERYQTIIEALDTRPDLELLVAAPWEGAESRLYRFR
jgi:hypothetical protein